jgi:hypothetical protein
MEGFYVREPLVSRKNQDAITFNSASNRECFSKIDDRVGCHCLRSQVLPWIVIRTFLPLGLLPEGGRALAREITFLAPILVLEKFEQNNPGHESAHVGPPGNPAATCGRGGSVEEWNIRDRQIILANFSHVC